MNKLYDNWILALRSGKYTHGKYFLRDSDNSFCCLGVLCDLSKAGKWRYNIADGTHYMYNDENQSPYATLPDIVQSQINFYDVEGSFNIHELSLALQKEINTNIPSLSPNISLTTINDQYDGSRQTFELIADILDERPPSLFSRSRNV